MKPCGSWRGRWTARRDPTARYPDRTLVPRSVEAGACPWRGVAGSGVLAGWLAIGHLRPLLPIWQRSSLRGSEMTRRSDAEPGSSER
jgi:hypothetical protein